MKNTLKYMIVALAGLSLLACNKKEEIVPQEDKTPSAQEYTYTIAVAGDTKSHIAGDHMAWDDGDMIGWFTDKAGSSEIVMTNPRSFNVSSTSAMSAGDYICAYAPYKAGEQSKTSAPLSIPTAQDGVIRNAMPMVSLPIELSTGMPASTDTPAGQASFISLGAVIEYNIYTSGAYNTEKVESVTFSSTSGIAGDFTVDLTSVTEESIPTPTGLDQTSVTSTLAVATTVGSGKAAGVKVYQVVAPGDHAGTVTVTTDKAIYRYTFDIAKTFNRGQIKPLNADLNSGVRTPVPYSYWFKKGDFAPAVESSANYANPYSGTFDGVTWTLNIKEASGNNGKFCIWSGDGDAWYEKKIQVGTAGSDYKPKLVTLSTSGIPGEITKLTLYYTTRNDNRTVTVSAKVGGAAYGTPVVRADDDYEAVFTGSASGSIEITIQVSDPTYALFLTGVEIEYDPDNYVPTIPHPTVEELLTANQWVLSSVTKVDEGDVTHTAGNKITFNANNSFTFDCTANNGKVWDYYYDGAEADPDFSHWGDGSYWEGRTLEWSVSNTSNTNHLDFTARAYPLVVVDDVLKNAMSYEIVTLTESSLVLHHNGDGGNFTITFTAASI